MARRVVIARGSSGDKSLIDEVPDLGATVDAFFNPLGVLVAYDSATGKELTGSCHGVHDTIFDPHAYRLRDMMASEEEAIAVLFHGGQSLQAPSQMSAICKVIPVNAVPTGGSYFGGTSGISAIFDVPRAAVGLIGNNQYAKGIRQTAMILEYTPEKGVYLIRSGSQPELVAAVAGQLDSFGVKYNLLSEPDDLVAMTKDHPGAIVCQCNPHHDPWSLEHKTINLWIFPDKPEVTDALRTTAGLGVIKAAAEYYDGALIKEVNAGIHVAQIVGLTNPEVRAKVQAFYEKLRTNPKADPAKHYTAVDALNWR